MNSDLPKWVQIAVVLILSVVALFVLFSYDRIRHCANSLVGA